MLWKIIINRPSKACMIIIDSLFRKIELQLLMNLTACALDKPARRIWTLPNEKALQVYAEYTCKHLERNPDKALWQRLNDEAYRMGKRLRKIFYLRKPADITRFTFLLYRNIGIQMEGSIPGKICVAKCYFSSHYTPAICQVASALDDGIIKGIAGGGKLQFQQRITEGCKCCLATFKNSEEI